MDKVRFACPRCQTIMQTGAEKVGYDVACPHCAHRFRLIESGDPASAGASDPASSSDETTLPPSSIPGPAPSIGSGNVGASIGSSGAVNSPYARKPVGGTGASPVVSHYPTPMPQQGFCCPYCQTTRAKMEIGSIADWMDRVCDSARDDLRILFCWFVYSRQIPDLFPVQNPTWVDRAVERIRLFDLESAESLISSIGTRTIVDWIIESCPVATPHDGKPPKTTSSIRASLESIHKTADVESHEGPFAQGMTGDYPIVVATFYDRNVARDLQKKLSQSGIFSKVIAAGQGGSVFVDNEDHDRASQLYLQSRNEFPNRVPKKQSRRFDLLIFGTVIGMTLGGVLIDGASGRAEAVAMFVSFTAIFGTMGHLLDRLRIRYYRTGRIRIGVWDLLIALSIIGMAIVVFDNIKEFIWR